MSTLEVGPATQVWLLWKRVHERVRGDIISRTTVPADVSDAELSVLVALYQSGESVRQSELARQLRWDRTRLSHLLTRMSARGYIERVKQAGGVDVTLLSPGAEIIDIAAPGLEDAAQELLTETLGPEHLDSLRRILERLDSAD